jgi:hypothetical protein
VDQQISLTQCISHTLKIHTLCFAHSLRKILHLYFSCFLLEKRKNSLSFLKPFFSCSQTLVCIFKLTEVPFYRPSFMLHGQQSPSSGFPATTFLHQALLLSTNGTIFFFLHLEAHLSTNVSLHLEAHLSTNVSHNNANNLPLGELCTSN